MFIERTFATVPYISGAVKPHLDDREKKACKFLGEAHQQGGMDDVDDETTTTTTAKKIAKRRRKKKKNGQQSSKH